CGSGARSQRRRWAVFIGLLEGDFRPLVLDAPGLVIPAWQLARLGELDRGADPEAEAQRFLEGRLHAAPVVGAEAWRGIDADDELVEALHATEDDLELVDARVSADQLLDAPRIDDDAADLLHVVQASQHAPLQADERTTAGTRAIGELHEIARAVAEQ